MAWNIPTVPLAPGSRASGAEGDFELFSPDGTSVRSYNKSGLVQAYNHQTVPFVPSHQFDYRLVVEKPMPYGFPSGNTSSSYVDEDRWSTWYHSNLIQDTSISSEAVRSSSNTTSSILDSGYGSIEYTKGRDIGPDQTVQAGIFEESIFSQDTDFCEPCLETLGKKKHFNNNADKRKHILTHTRPFKCDFPACSRRYGFSSPHDLARHKKSCHSLLDPKSSKTYYRCAAPTCRKKDKVWPRKDNFKAHLEGTHKYSETKVAEMLKRSECSPAPRTLRSDSYARQKTRRRRSQDGDTLEVPTAGEGSQDQHDIDSAMFEDDDSQPTKSMMLTHFVDASTLQQPQNIESEDPAASKMPVSDGAVKDDGQRSSPANSVDMMDICVNSAERTDSPFIILRQPSPNQQSDYNRFQAPCTPATDSESMETDWDDITTDTELDFELYDVKTPFQPLMANAVDRLLAGYVRQRPTTNANRQSNSNQSFNSGAHLRANSTGSSDPTRLSFGSKRGRNADEEDDENDEKPPRRKGKATKVSEDHPPLACPFNKHDPYKYDKCYAFVLKDMSRVKQHLERRHCIPIHCPKCYATFTKHDERDRHVRQGTCENAPERRLDGISGEQMRLLRRRTTGKGKTVQEGWYSVFELLFPGARKPESPFMDSSLSAELSAFRDFTRREGRDIVSAVILETAFPPPTHAELEDFARQVFLSGTERLFRTWAERPRSVVSPRVAAAAGVPPPTPPSTRIPDLPDANASVSTGDPPPMQEWEADARLYGEIAPLPGYFGMDEGLFSNLGGWSGYDMG